MAEGAVKVGPASSDVSLNVNTYEPRHPECHQAERVDIRYHTTVHSGLRAVLGRLRTSPYYVCIDVPLDRAAEVARRQVKRYPSIALSHMARSALRRAGYPAVQLVALPPDSRARTIRLILLSNMEAGEREQWLHARDEDWPLGWRNYTCARPADARLPASRLTWWLSEQARAGYRRQLELLITGKGKLAPGEWNKYRKSDEIAGRQVMQLACLLQRYPGFAGVRRDVFDLARYSTHLWREARPETPYPRWPTMPYLRFAPPQTAPLIDLACVTPTASTKEKAPAIHAVAQEEQ